MLEEDASIPAKESTQEVDPKKRKLTEVEPDFVEIYVKDSEGKNVKKFKCNFCDYGNSNKTSIKRHVASKHKKKHTKDKPDSKKSNDNETPDTFDYQLLEVDHDDEDDGEPQD